MFAGESLAQALRQLLVYGRDGLPVLSTDGRQVQGWVTNSSVLQAIARQIHTSQAQATQAQLAADWALPDPETVLREPPTPLPGYQMLEISVEEGSPAAGTTLGAIDWPPGSTPAAILHGRTMRDPDPNVTLAPGDRIILLRSEPPAGGQRNRPYGRPGGLPPARLRAARLTQHTPQQGNRRRRHPPAAARRHRPRMSKTITAGPPHIDRWCWAVSLATPVHSTGPRKRPPRPSQALPTGR